MAEQSAAMEELTKGLWRDNPVLVQLLGLCPALAVTNSLTNAITMGVATTFVLVGSSTLVSLIRNWIPKQVRVPAFIIIIATFVTVADFVLKAYAFDQHKALGPFLALIVVNCMILGRQEAFASRNTVGLSILDALGMSGGFTLTLCMLGGIREILGSGSLLGYSLLGTNFEPWVIMILPPGGFLTIGLLLGFFAWVKQRSEDRADAEAAESAA